MWTHVTSTTIKVINIPSTHGPPRAPRLSCPHPSAPLILSPPCTFVVWRMLHTWNHTACDLLGSPTWDVPLRSTKSMCPPIVHSPLRSSGIRFNHFPIEGHLTATSFLLITNQTAINYWAQDFVWTCFFIFLREMFKSVAGSYVSMCLAFQEGAKVIARTWEAQSLHNLTSIWPHSFVLKGHPFPGLKSKLWLELFWSVLIGILGFLVSPMSSLGYMRLKENPGTSSSCYSLGLEGL